MVAGLQLLFLYELEPALLVIDSVFNGDYIWVWSVNRTCRNGKKEKVLCGHNHSGKFRGLADI